MKVELLSKHNGGGDQGVPERKPSSVALGKARTWGEEQRRGQHRGKKMLAGSPFGAGRLRGSCTGQVCPLDWWGRAFDHGSFLAHACSGLSAPPLAAWNGQNASGCLVQALKKSPGKSVQLLQLRHKNLASWHEIRSSFHFSEELLLALQSSPIYIQQLLSLCHPWASDLGTEVACIASPPPKKRQKNVAQD